jgi:hypothetical protein
MTRARLLVVFIAVLLWPTHAHAARGFWGWLEELSGPGPFKGGGVSLPVLCVDSETDEVTSCLARWLKEKRDRERGNENLGKVRAAVMLNIGVFSTDDETPRFDDLDATAANNQGQVRLWAVTGLYVFRMRALDVGAGGGMWFLSGDGFDLIKRPVVIPVNATFAPFALKWPKSRYARILRFELENTFIPQGFDGEDFGNLETRFDSGPEFNTRAGIVIDFGALFR